MAGVASQLGIARKVRMSNEQSSIAELYSQHSNLGPLRLRQKAIEKEISLLNKEHEEITKHITEITGIGAGKRKFNNQCEAMAETVALLILCDLQKDVPVKDILNWEEQYSQYKNVKYPKPICKYEEQKEKVLKMYKNALH